LTNTRFSAYKKELIADVENAEAQRRAEIRRKQEAEKRRIEQQRRQLKAEFFRKEAERARQRQSDARIEKSIRLRREAQLANEEDQRRAYNALVFFTLNKTNHLKQFDEALKKSVLDEINNDLRKETFLVIAYQKMGHQVSTITDILTLHEKWSLEVLKESLEMELELSPLARQYFSVMVAPYMQPRPRSAVDDVLDLTRAMVRGFTSS